MRDSLKTAGRWLRVGWFWPLALLTFPMCYPDFEFRDPPALDPGDEPVTSAIMCDIPIPEWEGIDCLDPSEDVGMFASLASAAVALNLGDIHTPVLDFSSTATAACGGQPKKVQFFGTWPDGLAVCLNCAQQIPAVYADATAVCVAQCKDLVTVDGSEPPGGADAYCALNAHVSTNFDENACYDDFCSIGGTPLSNLNDPRRDPEDLVWTDFQGTSAAGSTLTFDTGVETGDFIAGAASEQIITTGDAWVEFEAGELSKSHIVGLRTSCDKAANCPDLDGTLDDIPLSISLNVTGEVNIVQNVAGTVSVLAGPFPNYALGERFRIQVVDHHDSTADISFFRYTTPCVPNSPCTDPPFYTYTGARPNYPLRVDATFRELNASLTNVTIMRIK